MSEFVLEPDSDLVQQNNSEFFDRGDAIILLIDASASMRSINVSDEIPLQQAIAASLDIMKNKVISSKRDCVSVVFYNCAGSRNANAFSRIFVYRGLEAPDAQVIVALTAAATPRSDSFQKFLNTIDTKDQNTTGVEDSKSEADMYKCFWTCSMMFNMAGKTAKKWRQRVFVLTDNDFPNELDTRTRDQCGPKVQDLRERGASVQIYPLVSGQRPAFDFRKFYSSLLFSESQEAASDASYLASLWKTEAVSTLNILREKLRCRLAPKRTLASSTMRISPTMKIAIRLYSMVQRQRLPSPVYLDPGSTSAEAEERADAQAPIETALVPLKHSTALECLTSAELVEEHQVKTYVSYASEKVPMNAQDMHSLKTMELCRSAGLTLMGFKPRFALLDFHQLRASYVVRADDTRVRGSAAVFNSLLTELEEMQMMAIGRLTLRDTAVPRFVALLPQSEHLDSTGAVQVAALFHAIVLPYVEDLRDLPDYQQLSEPPSSQLVDIAAQIVQKCSFGNTSTLETIENPELAQFYSALQALALNESDIDPVKDTMHAPSFDEELLGKFMALAFESEVKSKNFGDKRKAAGQDKAAQTNKKPKVRHDEPGAIDFDQFQDFDLLNTLKVAQLKEYLEMYGLVKSGKKAVLIERILDHMNSK